MNSLATLDRRRFLLTALGAVTALRRASGSPASLFNPNQLDFHYHGGLERDEKLSIDEWIDMGVAMGRRCFLLVDHLELYRPEPYKKYIKHPRYPSGAEGHREFLKEVDHARKRRDVLIFSGWEVIEDEIETGLDWEALRLVEAIGWHIKRHNGHELVRRIRAIQEVQKQLPVPMILYHPFSRAGTRPESSEGRSINDLRCLSSEVQKQMIDLLGDSSLHLEINLGWVFAYKWRDRKMREALIEDIRPLAEAGLPFTVGSDDHRVEDQSREHNADQLCAAFGIRSRQVNRIVGELLAQRAISGLVP